MMVTRALIVDDSPTDAYLASKIATELFDEVLVVTSASELTRTLPLFRPDIVFMDILLGAWENGLSLIQEVRHRDDEHSVVPFIVLSSKETEADIEWAKKQGAGAYVIKPATRDRVEAAVRSLFLGWGGPLEKPGKIVTSQYVLQPAALSKQASMAS
jgi:twitching motility two-component system response regulator PilH